MNSEVLDLGIDQQLLHYTHKSQPLKPESLKRKRTSKQQKKKRKRTTRQEAATACMAIANK
jgi:hypothetical protein